MIIGITGTNGAGKGTIVDYLVQAKGFGHYSARTFISKETERQGLPLDRSNFRLVANELRKVHGPSYVVEQLLKEAENTSENVVIESVRTIGEAELLKSKGVLLWAVDAGRKTRYERVLKRWSETDKVSFEQFCEYEDREMMGTATYDMNVFGVMKMADHMFHNDGTQNALHVQVEKALRGI